MQRMPKGLVVVFTMVALSCGGAGGAPHEPVVDDQTWSTSPPPAAPIEVDAPTRVAAPAVELPEAVVPSAVFATVDALCAAQKVMIVPRLEEAQASLRERDATTTLTPSCQRAPDALAHVRVTLAAPFRELAAIRIESGHATQVHLVVRTDTGWQAAPRAFMVDEHDDPGCPSIVRDVRVVEVRVEGGAGVPSLVVIDEAARGAGEEIDPDDAAAPVVYWSLELRRASACRLEEKRIACDEPVVTRALRTPGQGEADPRAKVRFTTSYRVDKSGHIAAAEAFDDASPSPPTFVPTRIP